MRRTHLATFEREIKPESNFDGTSSTWEEVTKEWVALDPQTGSEFVNATQTTATQKHIAYTTFGLTMASVDTACRMKVSRPSVVNESEPDADENFRIFNIEQIVNVREQNRELQLLLTEKV